jgi:hypothetical protein
MEFKHGDKIKCIKDVNMYSYNTSNEYVRTGQTAFIENNIYTMIDEFAATNEQGHRHSITHNGLWFNEHFNILI